MIAGYQHQRIKYENLSQAVIREHDLGMRFYPTVSGAKACGRY